MNIKNVVISIAFALCACLSMFSFVACRKGTDGLEYKLLRDGTYSVANYTGHETKVVIPNKYEGKKITEIGGLAFKFSSAYIVEVNIPSTVVKINARAFENCVALENVELGKNIQEIGGSAFINCVSLRSITIPSTVTLIKAYAFKNCTALTSVTFQDKRDWTIIDTRYFSVGYLTILEKDLEDKAIATELIVEICNDVVWCKKSSKS